MVTIAGMEGRKYKSGGKEGTGKYLVANQGLVHLCV